MSNTNHSTWMLSPKNLIGLVGAEYGLMQNAGVLKRFYITALLIVIIMLLTWASVYYAIDLLFHTAAIEITLAIFFCLLFVCIYIFLLNTFAKENRERKTFLTASNIIRIGFVSLMGFLIAQPLIIMLYSSNLSAGVDDYKKQLLKIHTAKIAALANDEITNLALKQRFYIGQRDMFGTSIYDSQINHLDDAIKLAQNKALTLVHAAQQTISRSGFFLYRVQKTNHEYPLSWLATVFIVLLFLLPGYLIYSISGKDEYYQLKKTQEKNMVMSAYASFLNDHKILFKEQVSIFSRYEDPPFNTARKELAERAPAADFIQKYVTNDSSY